MSQSSDKYKCINIQDKVYIRNNETGTITEGNILIQTATTVDREEIMDCVNGFKRDVVELKDKLAELERRSKEKDEEHAQIQRQYYERKREIDAEFERITQQIKIDLSFTKKPSMFERLWHRKK